MRRPVWTMLVLALLVATAGACWADEQEVYFKAA